VCVCVYKSQLTAPLRTNARFSGRRRPVSRGTRLRGGGGGVDWWPRRRRRHAVAPPPSPFFATHHQIHPLTTVRLVLFRPIISTVDPFFSSPLPMVPTAVIHRGLMNFQHIAFPPPPSPQNICFTYVVCFPRNMQCYMFMRAFVRY